MLPIDHIIARAAEIIEYYFYVAVDAPTRFTMSHWIVFSVLAVAFGFFCLRGFGSRKNY